MSSLAARLCDVMATSETARKGPKTSADRSGDAAIYAEAVAQFAEINTRLSLIGEGNFVPRGQRLTIWTALRETADRLSSLEAKRAQLEASNERPALTFCFGHVCRVEELRQVVDAEIVWGEGCGIVFPDSVTDSQPVFARYCSACGEKGRHRRRLDIVARVAGMVWSERVPVLGGWRVTCSRCGRRFFAEAPQRRRCDTCRH
jgi:hypothetical protein